MRGCPGQDPGFGLGQRPAVGLLDMMVHPAQRRQITLACSAAPIVGVGVVQVAADGGPPAAGEGAPALAGADQVPQPVSWLVPPLLPGVAAGAAFQPVEPQPSEPGEVIAGWARPGAGGGMGDGPPVGPSQGDAPAGSRPGRQPGGKVAAGPCVQGSEPGRIAWDVGQAEPRCGGHDQLHRPSQTRQP